MGTRWGTKISKQCITENNRSVNGAAEQGYVGDRTTPNRVALIARYKSDLPRDSKEWNDEEDCDYCKQDEHFVEETTIRNGTENHWCQRASRERNSAYKSKTGAGKLVRQ